MYEEYKPKEYYYMARMREGDSLSYDLGRYAFIKRWAELLQHAWWKQKREYKVETNLDYKVARVTRVN